MGFSQENPSNQTALQGLAEQQDNICSLLERGLYTEEMFLKRNAALTSEVKDLKQSIEEAERICDNKSELDCAKELFLPATVHVLDCYDQMTVEEKISFGSC